LKILVFPHTLFQRHFKLYDHVYITQQSMKDGKITHIPIYLLQNISEACEIL